MPLKTIKDTGIPSIEAKGPDTWVIRASRSYDQKNASGHALIKSPHRPNSKSPQHIMLVGARAWHSLGTQFLEGRDPTGATHCAQSGIAELGKDYAPDNVCDDTGLKIHAAEALIADGSCVDGARLFLRMLQERLDLYKELYKDEVLK